MLTVRKSRMTRRAWIKKPDEKGDKKTTLKYFKRKVLTNYAKPVKKRMLLPSLVTRNMKPCKKPLMKPGQEILFF